MTGQQRPRWTGSIGLPLPGSRIVEADPEPTHRSRPPSPAASGAASGWDDDPFGIRDERVAQLDLDAEDRTQPDLLVGRPSPDHPVQPLVVRDAEAGQAELDRPLGQLIRRGGAVEEREVRVAMELRIGNHRDT